MIYHGIFGILKLSVHFDILFSHKYHSPIIWLLSIEFENNIKRKTRQNIFLSYPTILTNSFVTVKLQALLNKLIFFIYWIKFNYKIDYTLRLQSYSISFYWRWILTNLPLSYIFILYPSYLQNFYKIKDQ